MIPDFITTGLLPVGIYVADIAEIRAKFGWNIHRERLLGGFERSIAALRLAGCRIVYLDGSFVTRKDYPGDFDACWEIVGVNPLALDPVFLDFSNLRAAQKAKYLGEFFPAGMVAEPTSPFRTFLNFFQVDKHSGGGKGIIQINL